MHRSNFEYAITLGLGRVIQYLQVHQAAPYRDIVLDACLHCTACDPQIEGTHAQYLHEIIQLTPDYDYFRDQILAALAEAKPSEDWDYIQLMYLTLRIAEQGYPPARDALYERLDRDLEAGFTEIVYPLLTLDGVSILQLMAEYTSVDWDYFSLAIQMEDEPLDLGLSLE